MKLKINFIFHESNEKTKEFTTAFINDLNKCLKRFKLSSAIYLNDEKEEVTNTIILLNSEDIKNEAYKKTIEKAIKKENTFILQTNQINQKEIFNYLKESVVMDFWHIIPETGEMLEYLPSDPMGVNYYWEKITDIVYQLKDSNGNSIDAKEIIYLAHTEKSQQADWDNLKRDLNDLNIRIVPERMLDQNLSKCSDRIEALLENSSLSIHLIPSTYSHWFKENHLSLVEFQCNITADYIKKKNKNFNRIIWIPSDIETGDEQNQIFIEKIQRDPDQNINTIILKCTLEDLKKEYRKFIFRDQNDNSEKIEEVDLYYISVNPENQIFNKLKNKFPGKVVKNNFVGITYKQHLDMLASAKCLIIDNKADNQSWLNMKINDIMKSPGVESYRAPEKTVLLGKIDNGLSNYKDLFSHILASEAEDDLLNLITLNN